GGLIDPANSHFVFQNSFTIGTDYLYVQNWNGSSSGGGPSQIVAGNSASGLPAAQLVKMRFVNPAGFPAAVHRAMILNTGEIVPAPRPVLQFARSGRNVVLTWPAPSILQSATAVTGPYADVASASSPYTNVIGSMPSLF